MYGVIVVPISATTRTRNAVEWTNCGVSRLRATTRVFGCARIAAAGYVEEREGEHERDLLPFRVVPEHGQRPQHDERDRNRDESRDAEELHGCSDPGELAHRQSAVCDEEERQRNSRRANWELLADECTEPFSGVRAEAGAHLLDDDEGNGDEHHDEERAVGELCAGAGVGEDAARVVSGVGRDQAGTRDGEKREAPAGTEGAGRRRGDVRHGFASAAR